MRPCTLVKTVEPIRSENEMRAVSILWCLDAHVARAALLLCTRPSRPRTILWRLPNKLHAPPVLQRAAASLPILTCTYRTPVCRAGLRSWRLSGEMGEMLRIRSLIIAVAITVPTSNMRKMSVFNSLGFARWERIPKCLLLLGPGHQIVRQLV